MLSTKIQKSSSSISGYGLFAKEEIRKGEVVWWPTEETMQIIRIDELDKLPEEKKQHWIRHAYQMGEFLYIDTDDATYMNHSCEPNITNSDDEYLMIAARDIEVGEEVTWNYMPYLNPFQEFSCSCGSKNCVGMVRKDSVPKSSVNIY